jgi:transcription-repair coupling factor (superfamily II helicase)
VDAHIPEHYIESERLRLEAYQKLSTASAPASTPDAIDEVLEELADRYGEAPEQVQNLIAVSRLRRRAQKAGLSEVVVMGEKLRIAPAELPDSIQVRLQRMYPGSRYLAQPGAVIVPLPSEQSDAQLIEWASGLLAAIFAAAEVEGTPAND